jgi:predicted dehydrogenase
MLRKDSNIMVDKVRIGIAGMVNDHVWFMGDAFAELARVEMVSAADPNEALRNRARSQWSLSNVYDDYRRMLEAERLDAIVVCSDNVTKVDVVEAAAAYGVHVCLDKPMSATLAQADRIIEIAEGAGITVMVAYHPYFTDRYRKAREWIRTGMIGQPFLARGMIGHAGPREVGLSPYFIEWLIDRERAGGGAFNDEAGYLIATFTDYFGPITEICAFMEHMSWRDYLPDDMEDNSVAIVRFANGALGVIDSKWGQIGRMPFNQSFHGSEGTILSGFDSMRVYSKKAVASPDLEGWIELPPVRRGSRAGDQAVHFLRAITEGMPPEGSVSLAGARHVQEVLEAAYISAKEGRVVKLPL